jgi:hypothetical protein
MGSTLGRINKTTPTEGNTDWAATLNAILVDFDTQTTSSRMKKVSNDTYESIADNTEYYSPFQHLGAGSTVYCQRVNIASPTKNVWTDLPTQNSVADITDIPQANVTFALGGERNNIVNIGSSSSYNMQFRVLAGSPDKLQYYIATSIDGPITGFIHYY